MTADATDPCQSMCWREECGDEMHCSLPKDHDGAHYDAWEGWEW